MKHLIFLLLALSLTACVEEANVHGDENGGRVQADNSCPIILTIPTVNVVLTSLDPMPPNLLIAMGGDAPDLDECSEEDDLPYGVIKLSPFRNSGNLYIPFFPGSEDYMATFPDYGAPIKYTERLRIYTRANCGDEPVLRYEFAAVDIHWSHIFVGKPECGGGGYLGSASLTLE